MRWTVAVGNMLVAHQLARLAHGIALLPDFMLEVDLEQGGLVRLLPEHIQWNRPMHGLSAAPTL